MRSVRPLCRLKNGPEAKIPRAEASQEGGLHQLGGGQQPSRSQSDEEILRPEEGGLHDVQQAVERDQRHCQKDQRLGLFNLRCYI